METKTWMTADQYSLLTGKDREYVIRLAKLGHIDRDRRVRPTLYDVTNVITSREKQSIA